jgi:hypothetical protein
LHHAQKIWLWCRIYTSRMRLPKTKTAAARSSTATEKSPPHSRAQRRRRTAPAPRRAAADSGRIHRHRTAQTPDPPRRHRFRPSPRPITPSLAAAQSRHRRRIQSCTGFRGVRLQSSGCYAAKISSGGHRLWLGTFETLHPAARAYAAAAWKFGRPRSELNLPDVRDQEEAIWLAPDSPLVTAQDR